MKNKIFIIAITFLFLSCNKSEFLDAKPDQALLVPTTLSDFQAILDYDGDMNGTAIGGQGLVPQLEESGTDNYYLSNADYTSNPNLQFQNYYVWSKQVYTGFDVLDWNRPYLCVLNANVVLDGLKSINQNSGNDNEFNRILGSALFYRSHMFFHLAQVFAPPYKEASANTDYGIPLRLTADIGEKIQRASIKETYERIIGDLLKAKQLLPITAVYNTRPTKTAVFGLLARVFQSMRDYDRAYLYADSCLQLKNDLIDYNELSPSPEYPFIGGTVTNKEVIFSTNMLGQPGMNYPIDPNYARIDSLLYNSYSANDLRKSIFFKAVNGSSVKFRGSYDGQSLNFAGIATDEIYLIRAECSARKGNLSKALQDLNDLLAKRWKKINNVSTYTPYSLTNKDEVLDLVLQERRKELLMRGLRWMDLRRLNLEGRNISVKRVLGSNQYILTPNDPRYTWPIPDAVINFNPDMPQNSR